MRALQNDVQEIYLLPSLKGTPLEELARQKKVPVHYKSRSFFEVFAQGGIHQGVAACLLPFPYASLQSVMEKNADWLLILDGIVDPRNLGALLRTAEAVGVGGVILPQRRSASLSPLVEKAAAGAVAYLPICQVENLARALVLIREAGYWLIGLAPHTHQTLYDVGLSGKIAFLLGGEEKGLRSLTQRYCDFLVSIPMVGKIESLNVSVAGGIVLYEFLRRKLAKDTKDS
ncbi:MAG: 23S rRNA (guanosine(2251)-2'-O)-methyltransferase RlmB [Deltaproteobacteria bacterium]|nr:23S rRNA (guanosine(2251)-2'-O)-methyltransferase RlmB [Deltaproteobacteria bacterium]